MDNDFLAAGIGTFSGRHVDGGRLVLEEVCRFENGQLRRDGHGCGDLDRLRQGILDGLKRCKAAGRIPRAIGVDAWTNRTILWAGRYPIGTGGPRAFPLWPGSALLRKSFTPKRTSSVRTSTPSISRTPSCGRTPGNWRPPGPC